MICKKETRRKGFSFFFFGYACDISNVNPKFDLFPVLVSGVADLIVHLDPHYGLRRPSNLEIRIPILKSAYEH